jgi:hypothetical protein
MIPRIPGRTGSKGYRRGLDYVESVVLSGSAIALTSNTNTDVTNISLAPGDWDVFASGIFLPAASTNQTNQFVSISATSITLDTAPGRVGTHQYGASGIVTGASGTAIVAGPTQFVLTATTTIYLVVKATFTVSTNVAYGILRARRQQLR